MCLFKSCIRHQPLKMLEQDCRFVTLRRNALETNANSQKTQVLEKSESFCSSPYAELSKALMRVPGSVHTSVCPTVCQHSRRLPNCLPTSPKMAQPSANICIAELFANIAEDRPTVCQHFWSWPKFLLTLPNCLPSMSYTGQLFASFAKDQPTVCQTLITQIIKLNPSGFCLDSCFSFRKSVVLIFSQVESWQRKFCKSEYEWGAYV